LPRLILLFLLLFLFQFGFGQNPTNQRTKSIFFIKDAIRIDTLSIIPGSVMIVDTYKNQFFDSIFFIDYPKSLLILKKQKYKTDSVSQTVKISYRVFPYDFSKLNFNKDTSLINPEWKNEKKVQTGNNSTNHKSDFFMDESLQKNGSISRGISFGNNQDASVNSKLDLQLSGKLNEQLSIQAAISDDNIPIQAEGNTQQIQEFDKIYIKINSQNSSLLLGDFELEKPVGYFTQFYKKVQGGKYTTTFPVNTKVTANTLLSGSISKGKFARNQFNAMEGNQGPYRLKGAQNEMYIIILSGTERVFIDGKALTRGQENDYVIDYNKAEITFTPKQFITKDKRIIVEFEYSDKSYSRYCEFVSNSFSYKKGQIWFNFFNENDGKNQSIDQNLTAANKEYLVKTGDSISKAFAPNIQEVEFKDDQVLYAKIDTVVDGIYFDNIYQYSTDRNKAKYRLGFSYIGENKGNYRPKNNLANGKTYQWIAPVNGKQQGNYEPVTLLVTPKKKQLFTLGNSQNYGNRLHSFFEMAVSNNDLNTFSTLDSNDDWGYALLGKLNKEFRFNDTLTKLTANVKYQLINKNFDAIERFRPTEFERDWNLSENAIHATENLFETGIDFSLKSFVQANWNMEYLDRQNQFSGLKNLINISLKTGSFELTESGSYLKTDNPYYSTSYLRNQSTLLKHLRFFTIGATNELESNVWKNKSDEFLITGSQQFNQYNFFIEKGDSSKISYKFNYNTRNDYRPLNNTFISASKSNEIQGSFKINQSNQSFETILNYRTLNHRDSLDINAKENNFSGRIMYRFNLLQGVLQSSTFVETGSGYDERKQFAYLEVPKGQGVYTWKDYNSNGIKELDEFEISGFRDEANYIRLFIPSNDFVKVFNADFNQMVSFSMAKNWYKKTGMRKFLTKFSDNLLYKGNRKNTSEGIIENLSKAVFNPHQSSFTTSSLSSFRNMLSFNRSNPFFGCDYIYNQQQNRMLLANGYDQRKQSFHQLFFRMQAGKFLQYIFPIQKKEISLEFTNMINKGTLYYFSDFLTSRNYNIPYIENETSVNYQTSNNLRFGLKFKFAEKQNTLNIEKSQEKNLGAELIYSIIGKSNLMLNANFILIDFNATANSPVAYIMLNGLQPGKNYTWSLSWSRNLTKVLQLNLNYTGRTAEGNKTIHTGNVEVRAGF
jgi:hypothetical protein